MIPINKVHWLVKEGLNKLDSQTFTDIMPHEIDETLNQVQLSIIREKLSNTKGFEFNRAITTDLSPLVIRRDLVTPTLSNGTFEIRLSPPDLVFTCLQYIRGDVKATKSSCDKIIPILDREYDDKTYLKQSSQQKSSFIWNRAVGYFGRSTNAEDANSVSLYIDTESQFTILEAYIDYIKQPVKVCLGDYPDIDGNLTTTSEFELSDNMIYEIISRTVGILAINLQYPDADKKIQISQITNMI